MKCMKTAVIIIVSIITLTACHNHIIHNRADEYRQAEGIAPMTIPSPYTGTNITAYYPIIDTHLPESKPIDLMPPRVR